MPVQPLVAPFSELTSLGVIKETTFATFPGAPSLFHAIQDFSANPTWKKIKRDGARKRRGQSLWLKGGYVGKASFTPEPDGDTLGQMLAYAMGAQTAPAGAPFVNTTLSVASTVGTPATITPVTIAGIFVGQSLVLDTSTNMETITVTAVNPAAGTFSATTTKAHTIGATLVGTSTTAKSSILTFGQLPSFSMELNRVTDAVDYLGCKVHGFTLTVEKNNGLTAKFDIVYANELIQGSPTAPTYSTKNPFPFTHPNNSSTVFGTLAGIAGTMTVHQFDVQVANNLVLDYYSLGAGPNVVDFPEQGRTVTGKAKLGFETDAAYQKFLGSSTGPSSAQSPVQFDLRLNTPDVIDSANSVNYGLEIILANAQFEAHGAAIKSGGIIYQDVSFEAGESANGANDDLKLALTNVATAVF